MISNPSDTDSSFAYWRHWAIIVALIILVGWVSYRVRAVLTPLLLSLSIAYILNPFVQAIEKRHIPRLVIVIAVFTILALMAVIVFVGIIERRVRGQKRLRTKQRRNNQKFASVRAIVELPFAFIKRLMRYTETRFIGLQKNAQYHFLLATAYNLRRAPGMQRKLEMG